ncbi:MAG: cytochrome c3 family protein [Planctomycetota bacterium]
MPPLRIVLPLGLGTIGALGLAIYLALYAPMPGGLAGPHAAVSGLGELGKCETCHDHGLRAGCLRCHEEIRAQLEQRHGLHAAFVARGETSCGGCHLEHLGAAFPLVQDASFGTNGRRGFAHAHVVFGLNAAHARLACDDCHAASFRDPVRAAHGAAQELRSSTLLGLDQTCARCHVDVHGSELAGACSSCHSQEKFTPASLFDHARVFPLTGAHASVECAACHRREAGAPLWRFHNTATTRLDACESCHPQHPHGPGGALPITAGKACPDCHDVDTFHLPQFGERAHAALDLPLLGGHAPLKCAACHDRPMDASWRQGDCARCHATPHADSTGRDCLTCHWFVDATWTVSQSRMSMELHERTGFPLASPHASLACAQCHGGQQAFAARYPGRDAHGCGQCHVDPHEPELARHYPSCTSCHAGAHFKESTFDVARHQPVFALDALHGKLACERCHARAAPAQPPRFLGLGKTCNACHDDPHRGQFDQGTQAADCAGCHAAVANFAIPRFDHARTRYPLRGEHARVACDQCHRPWPINGGATRQYRGTPTDCSSCHSDPHRGTLTANGRKTCVTCHEGEFRSWKTLRFDHETQASFARNGAHEKLACSACHLSEKLADGTSLIRYRPLPTHCEGCHVIKK